MFPDPSVFSQIIMNLHMCYELSHILSNFQRPFQRFFSSLQTLVVPSFTFLSIHRPSQYFLAQSESSSTSETSQMLPGLSSSYKSLQTLMSHDRFFPNIADPFKLSHTLLSILRLFSVLEGISLFVLKCFRYVE